MLAAKFLSDPDEIQLGIGYTGVALAFGLTVLTMAYAVGHVSAPTSTRPSPSVWLWPGASTGRMFRDTSTRRSSPGLVAGGLLDLIASGQKGFVATGNLAANGYLKQGLSSFFGSDSSRSVIL